MTAPSLTFGDLTIRYDDRVLEPRGWTQAQSRWAAELELTTPEGDVLELCTGVGHIGLLFQRLTGRRVVAVDVDPIAAEFARSNAAAAGAADRFDVRVGSMDEVLRPDERFAMVIADPPWVPHAQTGRYPDDPVLAIDGGHDGLDLARRCLSVATDHLKPSGSVVLQLGDEQQAETLSGSLPPTLHQEALRRYDRGVLVHLRSYPSG